MAGPLLAGLAGLGPLPIPHRRRPAAMHQHTAVTHVPRRVACMHACRCVFVVKLGVVHWTCAAMSSSPITTDGGTITVSCPANYKISIQNSLYCEQLAGLPHVAADAAPSSGYTWQGPGVWLRTHCCPCVETCPHGKCCANAVLLCGTFRCTGRLTWGLPACPAAPADPRRPPCPAPPCRCAKHVQRLPELHRQRVHRLQQPQQLQGGGVAGGQPQQAPSSSGRLHVHVQLRPVSACSTLSFPSFFPSSSSPAV